MINYKTIFKIIGSLLFIEAFLILCCLIMSLCYREQRSDIFLITLVVTTFSAFAFRFLGRNSDNTIGRREASLVVTSSWILFSSLGALPFIIGDYLPGFTDAFFEAMSGFTTTGATVIDNVEVLPRSILFWRSLCHWIGGLGIVFFTIALLPSMVSGSVRVFAAEATGPLNSKLHPRLGSTAKAILSVYVTLSLLCTISYRVFGMDWFDSINYGMATLGTGGFSTHNASIAYFNAPALEYVSCLFCFLAGTNFTLFYMAMSRFKLKELFKNAELRMFFFVMMGSSLFIAYYLVMQKDYDVEHAFRSSLFQVCSFMTTTGFYSDDAGQWPHITWVVLAICMFLGACSGSTSGGFKCIRGVLLLKVVKNEYKQILHPNAILPLKVGKENITNSKRVTLLAFLTVNLLLMATATLILLMMNVETINAMTLSLSSLSNVGPAMGGVIGPTMSWSCLPDAAKWICSTLMLIGRLEYFTVLIIFTPSFWKQL